ncbi:organic hydroperoxide resistance protein [Kineococcus rhizosphaerae]|uniref:Ohr subfamily peroxiredoxin n=1 Tax=Kineococcus rhizosphaerae TaxID=559628 RepID=A0A2T0QXE8_9ACTN|nr:organic hydroperoxide resistance protein [Kineococcus rhizosphaerae]PRY10558.1 Ohr subfamily peroxiredoxin [Kineococcus rhizosphaerae]
MPTLYEATATAWGGRDGRVTSSDDRLDLNLSIPRGMGGDDGPGTNPEQLFATGYAACFHSALKAVARARKVDVADSAVSVTVGVTGGLAEGIDLAVTIEAQLPGVPEETSRELLDLAHQTCPYSRATRGNVQQDVRLVTEED